METRGVWITNTDSEVLNSQQSIAEAMDFLAETGFNVVFPVVWSKAVTLYPSQVMSSRFGVEMDDKACGRPAGKVLENVDPRYIGWNPLAELINAAHRVGIKVIPWFEYGFASSYNLNGGPLLAQKPEWAACDRTGNLLNKNGFEWMNALDPQVQEFLLSLVLEVVKNYDIDGIQGDDRLPALPSEGGYDTLTVERYCREFNRHPPQNPQDRQWLQWRANLLTEFLAQLYQEVKAINSGLLVSMAPNIYDWGFKEYLQDSPAWLERQIVDLIHPQIYRRDFKSYKSIVDRLVAQQFTAEQLPKLAPGILIKLGSYRISPEYLLRAVEYNRSCGIQGEVFFFYEGLREDNNALGKVIRSIYK
ncbi:MAG: family 10 glycosylhydrolase [Chroococcidiopsidaceae cyanobacterium CP_BM_RX_35]|nr:family 10 glycosylhydrolase [Chroococcidiopsidaceae cyanobacterium CP_BM_RX_35]